MDSRAFVFDHIKTLFDGRSHITPTEAGKFFGWKESTSYHHKKNFPVKLVKVGNKEMVSLLDFVNFQLGSADQVIPPAKVAGRKSNKFKALSA